MGCGNFLECLCSGYSFISKTDKYDRGIHPLILRSARKQVILFPKNVNSTSVKALRHVNILWGSVGGKRLILVICTCLLCQNVCR